MNCSMPDFPVLYHFPEFAQLMFIESVMPSNHLTLCCPSSSCPQSFPASGSFPMSWHSTSGGQRIGALASALASVLPMNIQSLFPLELTDLMSLLSKGLSRVFSSTTIRKHQFFSAQASFAEGNDSPLQYSCLENPMDGGAWWAAVHGLLRVGHD